MTFVRLIGRRLLLSVLSLGLLFVLVFFASRLVGDPVDLYLPIGASEEDRLAMRSSLGLDDPLITQFGRFVGDLVSFDFGESVWQGRPAMDIVTERLPNTVVLTGATLIFSTLVAVTIGVTSAVWRHSVIARVQRGLALAGASIPDFWLGLMLIVIFAGALGVLPTSGTGGLRSLVLPVLTLSARPIGVLSQVVRSAVLEQIDSPYAVAARARGASEWRVVVRHALRNASLPSFTVTVDQLIQLLNGAVIVEIIFGWPGIGQLMILAIQNRDFSIVFAAVFVVAITVLVANLISDLTYLVLDPRLRHR